MNRRQRGLATSSTGLKTAPYPPHTGCVCRRRVNFPWVTPLTLPEALNRAKKATRRCFRLHFGGVVEPVVHAFVHLINVFAFLAHGQLLRVT